MIMLVPGLELFDRQNTGNKRRMSKIRTNNIINKANFCSTVFFVEKNKIIFPMKSFLVFVFFVFIQRWTVNKFLFFISKKSLSSPHINDHRMIKRLSVTLRREENETSTDKTTYDLFILGMSIDDR